MATVYEGVNPTIQRHVAIKVLLPEYAREAEAMNRFINEARAVNVIQHPGIVQVTDYGILPDDAGYIVMECLRGETLTSRLESCGGKLSASEAIHFAWQLASTLVAAHAAAIIHRDLKPSNVMLVPDPHMPSGERTKILDFGLAKLAEVRESTAVWAPAFPWRGSWGHTGQAHVSGARAFASLGSWASSATDGIGQ